MTDKERYNLFIQLWQEHAPVEYKWPHPPKEGTSDEDFERWFRVAIPAVFANLAQWQSHAEKWQYLEQWRKDTMEMREKKSSPKEGNK